ncbi:MAG: hypothetical protein AB4058_05740 [Microcystaceae cyanobacterium]
MPIGQIEGLLNPQGKIASSSCLFFNDEQNQKYIDSKKMTGELKKILNFLSQEKRLYVKFDLDPENEVRNIKLYKALGVITLYKVKKDKLDKLDKQESPIKIYIEWDNQKDIFPIFLPFFHYYYHDLSNTDIVVFIPCYIPESKKYEAIDIQKCEHYFCKANQELIKTSISSSLSEVSLFSLRSYIHTFEEEEKEAIDLILSATKKMSIEHQKQIIQEIQKDKTSLLLHSFPLREILQQFKENYVKFLNEHLIVDNKNKEELENKKDLIRELHLYLQKINEAERKEFWQQIDYLKTTLRYKFTFWNTTPIEYKIEIVKRRFTQFFVLVEQFSTSTYPYEKYINQEWHKLYKFDDFDQKLILEWLRKESGNKDYSEARMLSARGAEKLVINYYESLGDQVEDVSIQQVKLTTSQDWKLGDIRINSKELLDVKNARKDRNSKVYSEFCIPKFKQDEKNQRDVKIIAVSSPYLQLSFIKGTDTPPSNWYISSPIILGEFDDSQLIKLKDFFNSDLIQLDMSRGLELDRNTYLPPWIFDYSDKFYSEQINISEQFSELWYDEIPEYEDIELMKNSFLDSCLSLFVISRRDLPESWQLNLPDWKCKFIEQLNSRPNERLTLPYLYLSLLKHFLIMLSEPESDYQPQAYREILDLSSGHLDKKPLKIYDPLSMIEDLCKSLQILWQHRHKYDLTEFRIFKFSGRGLLRGKRNQSQQKYTTIMAFCGGDVYKDNIYNSKNYQGKCGFTPLVIGQNDTCETCQLLICPECGDCLCQRTKIDKIKNLQYYPT